eukprot:6082000-Amphidinium_carterae.1
MLQCTRRTNTCQVPESRALVEIVALSILSVGLGVLIALAKPTVNNRVAQGEFCKGMELLDFKKGPMQHVADCFCSARAHHEAKRQTDQFFRTDWTANPSAQYSLRFASRVTLRRSQLTIKPNEDGEIPEPAEDAEGAPEYQEGVNHR